MDAADIAQERIEREEAMRLHALSRSVAEPVESADECVECGLLIPSARQIASPGCQLCADCQADKEKREAMARVNGWAGALC